MASQGLNRVTIIGRVEGQTYLSRKYDKSRLWFRVHIQEEVPDKDGILRPRSIYLSVVAWGPMADALDRDLYSGCMVAVGGRLSHWKREGEEPPRWETQIHARDVAVLGGRASAGAPAGGHQPGGQQAA